MCSNLFTHYLNENVDSHEILPYLGISPPCPLPLLNTILELREQLMTVVQPRYTALTSAFEVVPNGVRLMDSNLLLEGDSIKTHLNSSSRCVILAATLGITVDRFIMGKQSINDRVICHAIANATMEIFSDYICKDFFSSVTARFSPGFGDLSLDLQPKILSLLNAQKTIGIFCNNRHILIPQKSITAILGEKHMNEINSCHFCIKKQECHLRKAGKKCGQKEY